MKEERVRIGRIFKNEQGVPCLRKAFQNAAGELDIHFIPVSAILQLADDDGSLKKLKDTFNHCAFSRDDVHACQAYAAVNMPERHEYKRNARERRMKILLDENMPYQLIPALLEKFGALTHIYFEDMDGYADEFIYHRPFYQIKEKPAWERKRDLKTRYIIFSRDRDMVDLARNQWLNRIRCSATPEDMKFTGTNIIVHIQNASFARSGNSEQLLEWADKILEMIESKQACAYAVSKSGVHPIKDCKITEMVKKVEEEKFRERLVKGDATEADHKERASRAAERVNNKKAKRSLAPV